jgi:flavodoxin
MRSGIVYYSKFGHTRRLAEVMAEQDESLPGIDDCG